MQKKNPNTDLLRDSIKIFGSVYFQGFIAKWQKENLHNFIKSVSLLVGCHTYMLLINDLFVYLDFHMHTFTDQILLFFALLWVTLWARFRLIVKSSSSSSYQPIEVHYWTQASPSVATATGSVHLASSGFPQFSPGHRPIL